MPIAKPWKRNLMWTVSIMVLIISLIMGQYAFSFVWAAVLVFVYTTFYRITPRMQLNRLTKNPFALGPFDVKFTDNAYIVRVNESVLELASNDLGRVHDFDDCYRLDHKSLFTLYVPKRALSEEEIGVIEEYRKVYPGRPENTSIPDF